jgi:hypothetical protein
MDGKVKPVGKLVGPLSTVTAPSHHKQPTVARHQPAAGSALPTISLAAGLGGLALAVIAGGSALLITRRGRRARTPPAQ